MSQQEQTALSERAAALRRAFDEAFALPAVQPSGAEEDFLLIRVGARRHALRVTQLAAIESRPKVVPIPAGDPAVLGLCGVQGRLVPLYSLASLLGEEQSPPPQPWLAVCGQEEPIGLGFDELEGYRRVPGEDVCVPDRSETPSRYVSEVLMLGGEVRYVLDALAIVAAIRERAGLGGGRAKS